MHCTFRVTSANEDIKIDFVRPYGGDINEINAIWANRLSYSRIWADLLNPPIAASIEDLNFDIVFAPGLARIPLNDVKQLIRRGRASSITGYWTPLALWPFYFTLFCLFIASLCFARARIIYNERWFNFDAY